MGKGANRGDSFWSKLMDLECQHLLSVAFVRWYIFRLTCGPLVLQASRKQSVCKPAGASPNTSTSDKFRSRLPFFLTHAPWSAHSRGHREKSQRRSTVQAKLA